MKRDRSGRITHVAEMDEAVRWPHLGAVATATYQERVHGVGRASAPRPSRLERWSDAMRGFGVFLVLFAFVVVLWVGLYTVGARLAELAA